MKHTGIRVRLLLASINDAGSPVLLAGQQDATLTTNLDSLSANSKDNTSGWNEYIGGRRGFTISCSGAQVLGDTAHSMIEEELLSPEVTSQTGQFIAFLTTESGEAYRGNVLVTTWTSTNPSDELATYSLELQGTGALEKISALPAFAPLEQPTF